METVLRILIIYLFVMIGLRVLGKREFGQLSPLELVMLLLIPEIASQSLVREDYSLTNALLGLSTLFTLQFLTSALMHRSKRAEELMVGVPTVLVQHGRLVEENLNRERVSPDEVFAEMRKSGVDRLEQVRWAVLETDGKIAVVPEEQGSTGGGGHSENRTIG